MQTANEAVRRSVTVGFLPCNHPAYDLSHKQTGSYTEVQCESPLNAL